MNRTKNLAACGVLVAMAAFLVPAELAGESISLDLKDADLKDVLRTFAELTKLNIAIDADVKGSVTLRLHDVPWDQALDVILRINGLGYVLEGNILRVATPARLLANN